MPKVIKVDAIKEACQVGNRLACKLNLRIAPQIFGAAHLSFSNVDLEDDNPNKMPFTGILLLVDTPSTKPPHGSRGHRILVPKAVARKRLSGLLGMGLNYEPSLESHAPRRKVGVISEAWLDGDKVRVKGFVYKKDFPEVEEDFKQGRLGMSMELANVYVRDEDADVWYLEDFHFTGATVLKKEAAAYYQTALAAKAAKARVLRGKGEKVMKTKKKEQRSVITAGASPQLEALVKLVTKGVAGAIAPLSEGIKAQGDALIGLRGELQDMTELLQISASAAGNEEDDVEIEAARHEDEDDDDMEAKREDDDDDDDMEATSHDDGDDEENDDDEDDMRAMEDLEEEGVDEEPGEVNKKRGDKNKGNKTSVTDPPKQGAKVPGNIAEKRLSSAAERKTKMKKPFPGIKSSAVSIQAAAMIGDLQAQVRQLSNQVRAAYEDRDKVKRQLKKMGNRYEAMEAQVARYSEIEGRRSLPADVVHLLSKSNLDPRELQASGMKLGVEQVDAVFDNSGLNLDPTQRMALKNKMLEAGLMEQGEVRRLQ